MGAPQAGERRGLTKRSGRALAAVVAALALVAVVAGVMAMLANANRGPARASGSHTGASQPPAPPPTLTPSNTPTPPPDSTQEWVALSADTPAGALAAFERSQMYASIRQSQASGVGDSQYDLSHPETPALVRELRVAGAQVSPDVWVIPYDSANGSLVYVAILTLNSGHTSIQPTYIEQLGTPRAHGRLAQYTQAQAISMAQAQSHEGLKPGAAPYLIYAPIDDAAIATGKWTGGGGSDTPLWLVPGADSQDRIVANDGKVYLPTQLPLTKTG